MRITLFLLWIFLLSACSTSSHRLFVVPQKPAKDKQYLFYFHEAKLEDLAPDDKLVKNYEKMITLLTQQGFTVFSEHRDIVIIEAYARKISAQIERLLNRGVVPSNITVVGYSKGSLIAQSVASNLQNPDINYVFLAGCSNKFPLQKVSLKGHILSIIDSNDYSYFSCKKSISHNKTGLKFKEIKLSSGLGHSVFRVPREKYTKLWQTPMKEWLAAQ